MKSRFLGNVKAASIGLLALAASATGAAAQQNVKIMMDWLIGGTHAPYFLADAKGYFKAAGVNASIDQGQGSTNVAVSVASGAYQFGLLDLPTLIKFDAQNPNTPLVVVYLAFDETPVAIVSPKAKGINSPKDLNGKKVSAAPGNAAREIASILLNATHAEGTEINWMPIQGNLVGAMLARGEVDAIGGQTTSQIPAAVQAGLKEADLNVLRYATYVPELYGLAFVTTKAYAQQNPDLVKGVVAALNHGTVDAIASPETALKALTAKFPLMQEEIELMRLKIALGHTVTENTIKNGLSSVSPERLQKNIDLVAAAFSLKDPPKPADIYSDRFLPPQAQRTVAKAN